MKVIFLLLIFLIISGMHISEATGFNIDMQRDQGHLRPTHLADLPDNNVYFKILQGFSFGRLLDQRMSNLHYTGPGVMISFGRYAEHNHYRSEWTFAGVGFQMVHPEHKGTTVYNPYLEIRYANLRKLDHWSAAKYFIGAQFETTANMRIAPALSNSFLYADFIGMIKPRADISYDTYLFDQEISLDFSLAFGLLGYGLRIPEYGATYQLGSAGGEVLTNHVQMWLHPGNFRHLVAGVFYHDSMGRGSNPNRFRIGYVWDYSNIRGDHGLHVYNTSHQLVLELLFLVN